MFRNSYKTGNSINLNFIPEAKPIPNFDDTFGSEQISVISGGQPGWHSCRISLDEGCYFITFTPNDERLIYHGTMRVDRSANATTISGDLYWDFLQWNPWITIKAKENDDGGLDEPGPRPVPFRQIIPIYPRNRYNSYLKIIGIQTGSFLQTVPCPFRLIIEQYPYSQPPAGSYDGRFRSPITVSVALTESTPPFGFLGKYYVGTLYRNDVAKGSFTM